jgi:hypothetical protein
VRKVLILAVLPILIGSSAFAGTGQTGHSGGPLVSSDTSSAPLRSCNSTYAGDGASCLSPARAAQIRQQRESQRSSQINDAQKRIDAQTRAMQEAKANADARKDAAGRRSGTIQKLLDIQRSMTYRM